MPEASCEGSDWNVRSGVEVVGGNTRILPTDTNKEETAMLQFVRKGTLSATAVAFSIGLSTAQASWEPTRPVEIVVPAGPGGRKGALGQVASGVNRSSATARLRWFQSSSTNRRMIALLASRSGRAGGAPAGAP